MSPLSPHPHDFLTAYGAFCALAGIIGASPAASSALGADVAQRMASGDEGALRELYDCVHSRALGVAMRVLRDSAEADDVVQEAFVEAWRRAKEFDAKRGGLEGWVTTIARSRAIDRLRSRASHARMSQRAARDPSTERESVPADACCTTLEVARMVRALDLLSKEQRTVVELAYFDGLTQSEIAARCDEPLGTVKTRIRLALAKLADELGAPESTS